MNQAKKSVAPRREFLKTTGCLAAGTALAGSIIPRVHAAEDNTIRLALIGCGGRGSGAVANALSAGGLVADNRFRAEGEENAKSAGPVKLVAMADVFENRLTQSHSSLKKALGDGIDVPAERQFIGLDAYRKAIDCLRPGDVAILTTHAAFRAPHLQYAIEKGVNVFMEKSFAADPGGVQKMLRLGEAAEKKNLKIGCGLMCRHSSARQAMIEKIRQGAMGDIQLIRAYRMDAGSRMKPFAAGSNEVLEQIRRAYQFLWVSSGFFIEYMIHQIDECCWIKDGLPISAHGVGGRSANNADCSQNLDSYSIEYTFADGAKAMVTGRYIPNCVSMARSAPGSFRATSTPRRRESTRTSTRPTTTWPGNRRAKRSIPGRPSGTCFWTPFATTSRTTRPGERCCRTSRPSWAGRPSTPAS